MRPHIHAVVGIVALAVLACSPEPNPLEEDLKACREATEEREAAAQLCETLYEAERDRGHHLAALADTPLPEEVRESVIIDPRKTGELPAPVQAEIAIQLDRYRAVLGAEIRSLNDVNRRLGAEIRQLRSELAKERTARRSEVAKAQDESQQKLSGVTRQADSEKSDLNTRLRKEQSERARLAGSLSKVSREIRATISSLEDFDRARVSCEGCNWKKRNRSTLLGFHSSLVKELLAIQGEAAAR